MLLEFRCCKCETRYFFKIQQLIRKRCNKVENATANSETSTLTQKKECRAVLNITHSLLIDYSACLSER